VCYDAFTLTDNSHARGTLGLRAATELRSIINEDANYEFD